MRRGSAVRLLPFVAGLLLLPSQSDAGNRFVSVPRDYQGTAAAGYAAMSPAECMEELGRRKIPHLSASAEGVEAPIRLAGPMHGVSFRQEHLAADEALNADGGIVDCRLALALDDFSALLAERGIVSVGFVSAYRRDTTGRVPAGQRHPAGLAMDVATFRHGDGTEWNVERDFHGRVGAKTCGPGSQNPVPRSAVSTGLRRLVCDTAAKRVFQLVLTPNYDAEHRNHVHLEVRREIRWFLTQ